MILNRQRRVRVSIRALEEFLGRTRQLLRVTDEAVCVCLVTNAEITKWNRSYRGKNVPTDVLSFRSDDSLPAKKSKLRTEREIRSPRKSLSSSHSYLGDIAIAPAVARLNARRLGRTFHDEMCILVLHGMLHLMGYDHETDHGQMERREKRLRRALGLGLC
jgi:probable rRNA maturation factor